MPLGRLPSNNTGRFWLAYNDSVNDHEMQVRYTGDATLADVMGFVADYLDAHDTILYLTTILGARYSGEGTEVSSPITWTGAATYGSASMPLNQAPRELCYLGRTTGGRRFRTFLYGGKFTTPDTYRFPSTSGSVVEAAIDVLQAAQAAEVFVAIDKLAPSMYTYADVQYNSYWETQRRG